MKKFIVAAALLVGMAGTAQAAPVIVAQILPNPTVVPFAVEDFGNGGATNADGKVITATSPYVTSTGLTVTFTGASGVYTGDVSSKTRSPFRDSSGNATNKNYLNARAGTSNTLTLTYGFENTAFNLLWGSVDPNPVTYNQLIFKFDSLDGSTQTITGAQVFAAAGGTPTAGQTNMAVWITGLDPFKVVSVTASNEAFEFSPGVPVPDGGTTLALLGGVLMGLGALRRKFNI